MLNKINITPEKQKKLIVYVALTLVLLAVYWQVNQYEFTNFDDDVYVTQNSHVQGGVALDSIRWAFATTKADFWHPLTWLSLLLDYQLYGLDAGGYHLTNLILHLLSALLLFRLLSRTTGAIWESAFVAAFFALHPLRVESVAWIAERKDVLSVFLGMLTLNLYVYYTEKPVIKRYLPVLLCFALALMSKPIVVTLPVIMIILDYWPLKRFRSDKGRANHILWQLKEKTPYFVLTLIFSLLTISAQYGLYTEHSLTSRLVNAPVSFVAYLGRIFWPHDMAFGYPFPVHFPGWEVAGAVLLIILISAFVIALMKCLPALFAGWLWYVITILPVIGIIPVGDPLADRYIYLSSAGIGVVVAWGVQFLIKNGSIRKKFLFPAGVFFIAVLSLMTWKQCGYWKNNDTLFSHALRVTKDNYLAHAHFASSLAEQGRIHEAVYNYSEALRIRPHYADAYNNRGNLYALLGQNERAIEDYNEAIRFKPDSGTFFNRGNVYTNMGRYEHAVEDYNESIRLKPGSDAYYSRAIAYFMQGRNKPGCADALKACELGRCQVLETAKFKGYCH